jgi:uncharacterized protein YndB with AHSA1/START domain
MSNEVDQKKRKNVKPGDDAVHSATGKDWQAWFEILDLAGARELDHKGIVAYLKDHHDMSPWWQQQVTVSYEQARGLRQIHEMPDGFQISRSKTIGAPISRLYSAWIKPELREAWLGTADMKIRSTKPEKSIRITWPEPAGLVEVNFYAKSSNKSQVTVQHSKLDDQEQTGEMKVYWAQALTRLQILLENG